MRTWREEIFGPVLQTVRADSFEQALELPSRHQYGNGVTISTRHGHAARALAHRVEVGMVRSNVPIPVPVAYHGLSGSTPSGSGALPQHDLGGALFCIHPPNVPHR